MTRLVAALLVVWAHLALAAQSARAEVERFAVLVGNNRGQPDEADLRYAESDAAKMRDVLLDLGGFRHENVVLMQGADAVAVRQAIVALNQRIRVLAGAQVVLMVYYSGHADAEGLHLGGSRFSSRELEQLVAGSAADVRLLVVDSCRSGAFTRLKGGRPGAAFPIQLDERLGSEGAIFLTASSANEDAQESELLKGSFFTHYLVSGMLGAADQSGDGMVNLNEAYRYAYDNTLRASSRTLAGTQHPSFRYALSGHGDLTLTWLNVGADRRGRLSFPEGRGYLVLRGDADGPVAAEVGLRDRRRTISVREGRYFVRARGREDLLEGSLEVAAGQHRAVREEELERIAYARLVRKGAGVLDRVTGPVALVRARSPLANSRGLDGGVAIGWAYGTPTFDFELRLVYWHGGFGERAPAFSLDADVEELGAELRLGKAWDTAWITLEPFLTLGGGAMWQRFATDREAPDRMSAAGHVDAGAAIRREVIGGGYVVLEAALQTYWFRKASSGGDLSTSTSLAVTAGIGWWL